ncbi:GGDEF domain-containing protein [Marinibactrum halimedae]|uniref:diguanylate cyclase n=1 Tax=Marinibactrum halimedae TaxID=1444977 RepID=A0AA37WND7_9GAMM|nr:GGDEF domain-containing protein [Marinibactrum halimedae]MCD9458379.1 GGDEF domain-containing protein [Marinibactrum halimedae]GLS26076.1 hypothetical protein GCM10007877_17910 [Marinibactrum halimedae]
MHSDKLDNQVLTQLARAMDASSACVMVIGVPTGDVLYRNDAALQFYSDQRKVDCSSLTNKVANSAFDSVPNELTDAEITEYLFAWQTALEGGQMPSPSSGVTLSPAQFGSTLLAEHFSLGEQMVSGAQIGSVEAVINLGASCYKWGALSASPMYGEDGSVIANLIIWHDITAQKHKERVLQQAADYDPLTNVFSRQKIMSLAHRCVEHSKVSGSSIVCLMLDIDNFKSINDQYGHAVGDVVLQTFAATLSKNIRSSDVFGRIGGEEFLLIAPDTDLTEGVGFAEKLRQVIETMKISAVDVELKISTSIGVSLLDVNNEDDSLEDLMLSADQSLYRAKHLGRNRVCVSRAAIQSSAVAPIAMYN